MVTASGKYGYWSSPIGPTSPDTYQIFPLGSDRYWVEVKVYTQEFGWLYNTWPESVNVGFGETVYDINIHIGSQAMEETITHNARGSTPNATVVHGILFLPMSSVERSAVVASLLDITGRKVLDLVLGANDIRYIAPGVYFIQQERGKTLTKAVLVQ